MNNNETMIINFPEFIRFVHSLFTSLFIVGTIGSVAGTFATFIGSMLP